MARTNAVLGTIAATALAATMHVATAEGGSNPFARGGFLRNWERTSNYATTRGDILELDALRTRDPVAVFRRDEAFVDTSVTALFRIDRVGTGDRAFGLIFGSTDSRTYFALEIGHDEMSLVRFEQGKKPQTLATRAVRDHSGRWETARISLTGTLFRGYYDNQVLEVRSVEGLGAGWIGVHARGGRAEVSALDYGGKPSRLLRAWQLVRPTKPATDQPPGPDTKEPEPKKPDTAKPTTE